MCILLNCSLVALEGASTLSNWTTWSVATVHFFVWPILFATGTYISFLIEIDWFKFIVIEERVNSRIYFYVISSTEIKTYLRVEINGRHLRANIEKGGFMFLFACIGTCWREILEKQQSQQVTVGWMEITHAIILSWRKMKDVVRKSERTTSRIRPTQIMFLGWQIDKQRTRYLSVVCKGFD